MALIQRVDVGRRVAKGGAGLSYTDARRLMAREPKPGRGVKLTRLLTLFAADHDGTTVYEIRTRQGRVQRNCTGQHTQVRNTQRVVIGEYSQAEGAWTYLLVPIRRTTWPYTKFHIAPYTAVEIWPDRWVIRGPLKYRVVPHLPYVWLPGMEFTPLSMALVAWPKGGDPRDRRYDPYPHEIDGEAGYPVIIYRPQAGQESRLRGGAVQPKLLHWSLPVSTVRGQWHVITCDAFGVPSRIATESYETTEVPGFWVDEPTGERLPSGNPKQRSVYRPTSDDDPEEPGYIEG